jgi:hypothetical protein
MNIPNFFQFRVHNDVDLLAGDSARLHLYTHPLRQDSQLPVEWA